MTPSLVALFDCKTNNVRGKSGPILMLVQYIGEHMDITININDGIKESIREYHNCNTTKTLIFGGFVKVRESLYF